MSEDEQWLEENWITLDSKIDYLIYQFYNEYTFSDIYFNIKGPKLKVECKALNTNIIPVIQQDIDSNEIKRKIDEMTNGNDAFIYVPTIIQYNGHFRAQYISECLILRVIPNQVSKFKIDLNLYMIEKIRFKNHLEQQYLNMDLNQKTEHVIFKI